MGRNDLGKACLLAVGMHGVFALDPATQGLLRLISFDAIPSWAYTSNTLVLSVGTFVQQEKMLFRTNQAKEINLLLRQYVDYLSGGVE